MPEPRKCRNCRTGVPSNAPFSLCPQCLLALGFGPDPQRAPSEQSEIGNPQSPTNKVHSFGDHELLFEQSWALTVIESVLEQLRKEYTDAGKGQLFHAIHSYLEDESADTYAELAANLNMTEGAVKMAVLRLRENFRQRLRSEIAKTVANPGEVDEELRHLFACLRR